MNSLPSSILDHASAPQNRWTMKDADAVGRANLGGRPPEVSIFLKAGGSIVEKASFEAHGCGYTIACCSVLTELAIGKPVEAVQQLGPADIYSDLGEFPRERQFCATLAVEALQDAIQKLLHSGPKEGST